MTTEQFPPVAWWYDTVVSPSHGVKFGEMVPLGYEDRDGTRFVTYQVPENPVEPGSVSVDGYLFSNLAGELVDGHSVVAGTVDFATGLIEIDLSVSPDPGSRIVQYLLPG